MAGFLPNGQDMQPLTELSVHLRPCARALRTECHGHNHQFLFWPISQMLILVLLTVHVNFLTKSLLCSFSFILVYEHSLRSTCVH